MKKLSVLLFAMAFAMVGVMATPNESSAVPSFARQMNLPCYGCHFQHIPKLNAFGRAFKGGGYIDSATALIEDDNLSLPANLPISVILKYRYQMATNKTASTPDKKGTERGEWQFPDEFALFAAGRAGKNVGYLFEGADALSGKVLFVGTFGEMKAAITPWHTDAAGPFFGFESFNTGLKRPGRAFEHRAETVAAQAIGLSTGAATGITGYIESHLVTASVGLWGPTNGAPDTGFDLSTVYRVAVTPNVGGFDGMIGVFGVAGKTKCVNCGEVGANESSSLQEFKTEAFGVDTQWQGEVGGMPLEVQGMYADVSADDTLYIKGTGISALAELGLSKHFGVGVGYGNYDNKKKSVKTTATTLALWWNVAQNVMIRPEYSMYSDDGRSKDNQLTVMLFAAF